MKWLSDKNAHNIVNIKISFLIWTILYLVIYSRKTSKRILQIAPNSVRLKRQELAVKVTSIIHAVYTAYYANLYLQEFKDSEINFFKYSENAESIANVAAGFFIADLILCIILIEEHGIQFVVHAIAALGGSLYVSLSGVGHQYFLELLLFEASTPFLHIGALLIDYGYGKTIIFNINNLIFLLTFAYFRLYKGIPTILNMCNMLITERPISDIAILFFVCSSGAMSTLNIYWFYKICRRAVSMLRN